MLYMSKYKNEIPVQHFFRVYIFIKFNNAISKINGKIVLWKRLKNNDDKLHCFLLNQNICVQQSNDLANASEITDDDTNRLELAHSVWQEEATLLG